jgi:signal transduction histidine kinase
MRSAVQYLGYVNLALFTGVAVAALLQWRAGRGRAGVWAALTFGSLALVADIGEVLPDDPETLAEKIALRGILAVLVLFPYLLYRFTTAFRASTQRLERFLGVMTVVLLVWTFALPDVPSEGESQPSWFRAYLVAFVVHWTVLTIAVAIRLWRAGRHQPSVARRRMRLLAGAATAITVAIFLAAFGDNDEDTAIALAGALLATVSAVGFLFGLAPPATLRVLWRRPEQERLQSAIRGLLTATTEEQVVHDVLPEMARMVGARAVALYDPDGRPIGAYGPSGEVFAGPDAPTALVDTDVDRDVVRVEVPSGSLLVYTSPYAPYFGTEEMELLRTLGSLTGLALDRARLFAREREARAALERADELKTNFVALAAHELRTPVATIDGIVQTIHLRGDDLPHDHRKVLEDTLRQQSTHMRVLVDQLLDLSRLDAEAVRIEPRSLPVREHVQAVVTASAGERADEVEIQVDGDLEAMADATAFDRIVANLIVNALRYGAPPVVVRAEQRDRHVRVAVEDHGPGVPAEFVPNLFERFTRGRTTRERVAGTGLGLAIARSYASAHGGELVYSNAEPHGARFELILPVRPAPQR